MGLDSTLYKETHLWNFNNDKISIKVSKNDIRTPKNEGVHVEYFYQASW